MSGRYTKAELLTALWKLSTDDERIPTSHGILDRALRDCQDTLPDALKNGLSFGVTGVGLRCFELPDILLAAQEAMLTSEPNPTYLSSIVTLDEGRARLSDVSADLYRTFLDKPPASEFGSIGVISGTSGNDIIDGTYLDAEGDAVSAVDDFILAGSGDDTINSAGGNDVIYGGSGDDLLLGGAGNDTMTGDAGIDTFTGGSGADVFVFKPNTGTDTIADFDAAEGDLIQIYGVSGQGEINLVQVGGDTEIRTTAGDVLAVAEGVHLTDFGDFLFG